MWITVSLTGGVLHVMISIHAYVTNPWRFEVQKRLAFSFHFIFQLQTGYPDKFLHSIGFNVEGPNFCRWCPEGGPENCGLHRQSPIDLKRECAIEGDPIYNECIDWRKFLRVFFAMHMLHVWLITDALSDNLPRFYAVSTRNMFMV